MSEIEWADPPQLRTDWASVANALRGNPGKWARIKRDTNDTSLTTRINQGYSAWGPVGAYQGRSVATSPGRFDVYARFVGEVTR